MEESKSIQQIATEGNAVQEAQNRIERVIDATIRLVRKQLNDIQTQFEDGLIEIIRESGHSLAMVDGERRLVRNVLFHDTNWLKVSQCLETLTDQAQEHVHIKYQPDSCAAYTK